MPETLLILGASARAAAMSALRAGFAPCCADRFADADLQRIAHSTRVDDYPAGLARAAESAPPGPWMYTGGLENHPDLIDRIAAGRPLLGNPGRIVRAARRPTSLAAALRRAGIACPNVRLDPSTVPDNGTWLSKPLRGSGGLGIRVYRRTARAVRRRGDRYYQQFVEGESWAAVYVAAAGRAILLGVTRQIIGAPWLGAKGFLYAGTIGPIRLEAEAHEQSQRIGDALAEAFGLVGLFGIDAVVAGGAILPVEINPRYAASVEVLERALGIAAVAMHADCCRRGRLPDRMPSKPSSWCGKAIVYARRDAVVSPEFTEHAARCMSLPWPELADIPEQGARLRHGAPVATVLAEQHDEIALVESLQARAAEVQRLL